MIDDAVLHEFAYAWALALARRPTCEVLQPCREGEPLAANAFPDTASAEVRVAALLRASGADEALHACVEAAREGAAILVATHLPDGGSISLPVRCEGAGGGHPVRDAVRQYYAWRATEPFSETALDHNAVEG